MEITEEMRSRYRDAERFFLDELRATQALVFLLPYEEIMRRENAALAELLDNPERYSWA